MGEDDGNQVEEDENRVVDPDDEEQPAKKKFKPMKRKNLKKKAKQEARTDKKNDKDLEHFKQDIDDDPAFRAQFNLYKDDDVIATLEAGMGSLSLNPTEQSNFGKAMKEGMAKIQGEERPVKQAARKTEAGKNKRDAKDKTRTYGDRLLEASTKQKTVDEDGSDLEPAEEDAPAVRIEELLDNLQIHDDNEDGEGNSGDDWEDDEEEGGAKHEESKKRS